MRSEFSFFFGEPVQEYLSLIFAFIFEEIHKGVMVTLIFPKLKLNIFFIPNPLVVEGVLTDWLGEII